MASILIAPVRTNVRSLSRQAKRVKGLTTMPYIENDDAGFFRGIVVSAVLVAPFWAAFFYVVF